MRKLLNRKVRQQAGICVICHEEFTEYDDIVRTTRIRKEWAELGDTTIQIMCKQHIGGATERKDQLGLTTDGPSVAHDSEQAQNYPFPAFSVQTVCLIRGQGFPHNCLNRASISWM
jgi:hypothetical protein